MKERHRDKILLPRKIQSTRGPSSRLSRSPRSNLSLNIRNICYPEEESLRIKVWHWSACHCDCCHKEVFDSMVGDQLQSKCGRSDTKPGQFSSFQEEASKGFIGKSEGGDWSTQSLSGKPQQHSAHIYSILDKSVTSNTGQERWLPWKMPSPQEIQRWLRRRGAQSKEWWQKSLKTLLLKSEGKFDHDKINRL